MTINLKKIINLLGVITMVAVATTTHAAEKNYSGPKEEIQAITDLLDDAYLKGFYHDLDPQKVKQGFHPEMVLTAVYGGQIIYVPLEEWMAHESVGVKPEALSDAAKAKKAATLTVDSIKVVGNAASVEARVHIDGDLIYTNFYGLHKFDGKWVVVTKLFNDHAH